MTATYLRRGLAAGLLAGLLAGLFAFVFGEPTLDRAIALEGAAGGNHDHGAEAAAHHHHGEGEEGGAPFGRATQKVGLFFATGLTGLFVGGIFGLAFASLRPRMAARSDWAGSLGLAGAVFLGAALIPFLKYPSNPPTVGDPETIGVRTVAYFGLVGMSLLTLFVAWRVHGALRERGSSVPVRQLAVGAGTLAVIGALYLTLPAAADPGGFPAGLLWEFRISSLGTQLVLWGGLGLLFGALCERAGNASRPA